MLFNEPSLKVRAAQFGNPASLLENQSIFHLFVWILHFNAWKICFAYNAVSLKHGMNNIPSVKEVALGYKMYILQCFVRKLNSISTFAHKYAIIVHSAKKNINIQMTVLLG